MSTSSPTAPHGTPEEIRALVAFLNTEDFRTDTDALKTPRELEDWLRYHGLSKAEVTWADLSLALEVRDALRALLVAHLDGTLDTGALRADETCRAVFYFEVSRTTNTATQWERLAPGLRHGQ